MSTAPPDPASIAQQMTADDVREAIADYDGGIEHPFAPSTGYDLIHEGRRYPPKAIYGLAARRLVGRVLEPSEFSGGEGSMCFQTLRGLGFEIVPKAAGPGARRPRVWVIALGEGSQHFEQFYQEGIIAIGWTELGDLSQYPDKESIAERITALDESRSNPFNDAQATYAFVHVMQEGDLAVVKGGRSSVLGLARVTSPYLYEPERTPYQSLRRVEWLSREPLELPERVYMPVKTLTDISDGKNPALARALASFYGLDPRILGLGEQAQDPIERLRAAWAQFQEDPVQRLWVQLRLKRAEELRTLLADPERIGVDDFNREVWQLENRTLLDGQDVTGEIWSPELSAERATELLEALEAGRLEYHGNAMWGTGSRTYAPRLADPEEKLALIRQALTILNDEQLEPAEKARQIGQIHGFGSNSATGLVMVKHPDRYTIYNTPSTKALHALGYEFKSEAQFQEAAADLRGRLGIDSFIALDHLLYWWQREEEASPLTASAPRFWWVNQGHTYGAERDGGYLWAPLADRGGRTHGHHAAMAELRPGDWVLHYANKAVRAVSTVTAAATEAPQPAGRPGEPAQTPGRLVHVEYQPLDKPIELDAIPAAWREAEAGPFDRFGSIKQGYLYELSENFVGRLAGHFPDRLGMLPVEPQPTVRTWLFQTNPKTWSFTEHAEELRRLDAHPWPVSKYAEAIRPGHRVLIWESGADAGLVAIGEVVEGPGSQDVPEAVRRARGAGEQDRWLTLRYTQILDTKLGKEELAEDPTLAGMQLMRSPQDATLPVTTKEWAALQQLLAEREAVEAYEEPPFEAIRQAIGRSGLRIEPAVLRRYHLSLKTRGFVILAGISGTGKTRLAEEYARAVGAERRVVAVAPNWNSNEDLLGFFNPLEDRYAHTAVSRFLYRAEKAFSRASAAGVEPAPYHLILDEMNLARVEHYFAKFLSAMERRRDGVHPEIDLGGDRTVTLPPNLKFIGTVNMDETTHGFADKVYDRAQTVVVAVDEQRIREHIGEAPYAELLMELWKVARPVAPFAFRVVDEVAAYVREAEAMGVPWEEAADDQVLQKILPKFNGTHQALGEALERLIELLAEGCPHSHAKAQQMHRGFLEHGFVSYF